MFKKGALLTVACLAVLAITAVSFVSLDSEDTDADDPYDIANLLDNATTGTVRLTEDSWLSRDATVKNGVILDDNGFSLKIPSYVTLSINGEFKSSGNLEIGSRGIIGVPSEGKLSVNNEGHSFTVFGSLEVYRGGTLTIGDLKSGSKIESFSNSRVLIDGDMFLGYRTLNSNADLMTVTISGSITISDGSIFRVSDNLTIGNIPTLTTELNNTTSVNGIFNITDNAYVLVYGKSEFNLNNIRYPTVNSKFMIQGDVYATEYMGTTGNRNIVIPSASSLRDYTLESWKDSQGNKVPSDLSVPIGSPEYKSMYGEVTKRVYRIILTEDDSIRWVVNGITKGSSSVEEGVYGATMTIGIRLAQGYTELPTLKMEGVPFAPGTSFEVTGDVTFTTSNNIPPVENDIMPTLLVILAILLVVLAILYLALRHVRSVKDKAK